MTGEKSSGKIESTRHFTMLRFSRFLLPDLMLQGSKKTDALFIRQSLLSQQFPVKEPGKDISQNRDGEQCFKTLVREGIINAHIKNADAQPVDAKNVEVPDEGFLPGYGQVDMYVVFRCVKQMIKHPFALRS